MGKPAIECPGWSIKDRESAYGITVQDATGRSAARVPPRPDDLDIARAITVLPKLLAVAEQFEQFLRIAAIQGGIDTAEAWRRANEIGQAARDAINTIRQR